MARQMKKALCVLLTVLMAFSCFAVSAFAYTGYDHSGSRNDLRVQANVSVDKSSYAAGDTVTATITLDHPDDAVLGVQGSVAFDGNKLDFKSISAGSDFAFYDATSTPTASESFAINEVHNGISGNAYNASSFGRLLGAPTFSSASFNAVTFAVINTAGVAAAEGTAVVTLTFEAKAAVNSTAIALIPSNAYHASRGFFSCVATTCTNDVYESVYAATEASDAFEITGGSTEVSYTITFTWHDGYQELQVLENTYPEEPTVPDYADGDYDFSFLRWNPTVTKATAPANYSAQYDEGTFVSASYDAYNQAKADAIAKRDNGTNWTQASINALNTELNKDVSGKGRTKQSEVEAQKDAIIAAAAALAEEAATYTVRFVNEDGSLLKEYTGLHEGETVRYDGDTPTKAGDAQYSYSFKGWNPAVTTVTGDTTYTAQYNQTVNNYTITFKNYNGSILKTVQVPYGSTPSYTGSTPQKPSTEQYSYAFAGWSPALASVTGDAEYTAQFNQTERKYDVIFANYNGDELQFEQLAYGATPVYKGATPTKPADNTYTYTFDKWSPAVSTVTGDVTYTATFKQDYIPYTVYFVNEDNSPISTKTYHYGQTIERPDDPTKPADNTYTYTFAGWSPAVPATVTQDGVTYKATFDSHYIPYTITFNWANGGQKVYENVHWGDTVEEPTVPSYDEGGKTYSFKSWDPSPVVACAGDATYTATYSDKFIVYNITFIIGEQSTTQQVNAGSMPVVPIVDDYEDGDYDVSFTGWDTTPVAATADATYTAQFSRTFVAATAYAEVEAAQAAALAVERDNYTADSLAVLDAALNAVQTGYGRTRNNEVEAWATAINEAIGNLVYKPADYAAYNAAVTALETELAKTDLYTPDSIDAVRADLTTIDTGLSRTLNILEQSQVDTARDAVAALAANLVEKADKADLESLINQAEALDSDKYIDFSAVSTALVTAKQVLADDNATTTEVGNAIKALNSALSALEFKPADYDAWNAQVARYDTLNTDGKLRYYTAESKAAVEETLAKISLNEDINYQTALDALVSELKERIDTLAIIDKWAGEKDWEDTDHEWFYSNLEFEKEVDPNDSTKLDVKVYLNHPSDTVSGIFVAMLFDKDIVSFDSADINGGSLVYANEGDAQFNPADFEGYRAMSKAGVVKFAAEFDTALAPTNASRDLIATLHFTAINSGSSYFKAVPLASNTAAGHTVYSALLDNNGVEKFMHTEFITAEFTGIITIKNLVIPNKRVSDEVTTVLKLNTTSVDDNPEQSSEGVAFTDVAEGTYSIEIKAPGSLGYVINNIKVDQLHDIVEITDKIELVFGDYVDDSSNAINIRDISAIITQALAYNHSDIRADVNGDGYVRLDDVSKVITNYGYTKDFMVLDL